MNTSVNASTSPASHSPPSVSIEVKIVGVIGCSASGKSTAAHQLARCLRSPLHPISTDQFFLDDVCAELGSYDDYRCVDYAEITHWMKTLKHGVRRVCPLKLEGALTGSEVSREGVEAAVRDVWCAEMVSLLPGLQSYLYLEAGSGGLDLTNNQPIIPTEGCGRLSNRGDDDSVGDDASLCAHEAEEEERRARATAIPASLELTAATGNPTHNTPVCDGVTLFVVWEGFTILCSADVSACVDCAVHVRCDPETACLRRFFRSPRRHLVEHAVQSADAADETDDGGNSDTAADAKLAQERRQRARAAVVVARVIRQLYRARIEQMWAARSREAQRAALQADVLRELRSAAPEVAGTSAAGEASVLRLLAAGVFDPPRPHSTSSATADATACAERWCWTREGVPTLAFQHFWEVEFDQWLLQRPTKADAEALSWAALRGDGNGQRADVHSGGEHNPSDSSQRCCDSAEDGGEGGGGRAYVEKTLAERGLSILTQEPRSATGADAGSDVSALDAAASPLPSPALVAKALAPFYYEFRYWFFFEVLYYDRLLSPLQEHRLRCRSVPHTSSAAASVEERQWWELENGRRAQGKVEEDLLNQVQRVAAAIFSSC
jgi:hypothetical protein